MSYVVSKAAWRQRQIQHAALPLDVFTHAWMVDFRVVRARVTVFAVGVLLATSFVSEECDKKPIFF